MIYHDMIAVSSLHQELRGSRPFYHEPTVNHEFSDAETKARESIIRDMIEYIKLYKSPFQITEATEKQLHNIISQEVMPTEVREGILSVESKKPSVVQWIQKRFLDQTKKLSDTIHRNNIKTCQSIKALKPSTITSKKKTISEAAAEHRVLEIAQARGHRQKNYSDTISFQHFSYLFDEDG